MLITNDQLVEKTRILSLKSFSNSKILPPNLLLGG